MSIQCTDFYVVVSISDLVMIKGEGTQDCVANPYFTLALSQLYLDIDPVNFYTLYFEKILIGKGDVYLFKEDTNGESTFAINLYRDIYDQLDIISFGIRTKKNGGAVRTALRSFFDTAEYQICYEESHISEKVSALIDSNRYPNKFKQSGYEQKLILVSRGDLVRELGRAIAKPNKNNA